MRYSIDAERLPFYRRVRRNPDAFGLPEEAHLVAVWPEKRKKVGPSITAPDGVARFVRGLSSAPVERLLALPVDRKNRILGVVIAAQGSISEAEFHPREVFAAAIGARASAVILVHNHPSGDPTPSDADRVVTARMVLVGKIIDIPVLDHVVVGRDGAYASLQQLGMWPGDEMNEAVRRLGVRA